MPIGPRIGDVWKWPEAAYQKSRCGKRRERIEGWAVGGQEWRLNPQQQAVSEIGRMVRCRPLALVLECLMRV
jgi:hypothetical protein